MENGELIEAQCESDLNSLATPQKNLANRIFHKIPISMQSIFRVRSDTVNNLDPAERKDAINKKMDLQRLRINCYAIISSSALMLLSACADEKAPDDGAHLRSTSDNGHDEKEPASDARRRSPFDGEDDDQLVELKPSEYPIEFLQRQFADVLGEEWDISVTASTILLKSKFSLRGFPRIATYIPTDKEELDKHSLNYEIKLTFTPPVGDEEIARLRAERNRLIAKIEAGSNGKTGFSETQKQISAIRIPSFSAIDHLNVLGFYSRGWAAYFDTTDGAYALFKPLSTYQKCKAAEAIIRTYFLPIDNRYEKK